MRFYDCENFVYMIYLQKVHHPGRVCPLSSWLPELLGPGKAQNAGPTESELLWNTQKLEPHPTQGPLHIEQPGSSVDWGNTHPWARQTQCGPNTVSATHTQQYLSAVPLPPLTVTEPVNLNKRPPPPACVRAEIRHWRDLQTEAK